MEVRSEGERLNPTRTYPPTLLGQRYGSPSSSVGYEALIFPRESHRSEYIDPILDPT